MQFVYDPANKTKSYEDLEAWVSEQPGLTAADLDTHKHTVLEILEDDDDGERSATASGLPRLLRA